MAIRNVSSRMMRKAGSAATAEGARVSRISRSRFLTLGAAAATLPYVEWVRPALAQAPPSKLSDIEHIVILMQENRSFDHYFGTLSGVRGFADPSAVMLPEGQPVFYQPNGLSPDGFVLPFHLDTAVDQRAAGCTI